MSRIMISIVLGLCATQAPAGPEKANAKPAFEPTSSYKVREMHGFKIYIHKTLVDSKDPIHVAAFKELDCQLFQVSRIVPKKALTELRKIPIWMESKSEVVCACHHPSKEWLIKNGFNPQKAKAVELGNMKNFVNWTKAQPWMVMHELAHGYHQNVVGHGNKEWLAAYKNAMDKKLYDEVLHINGKKVKAYACNNDKEYFAELTEAYFGTNDMYPFVRAELKHHDPVAFKLLEKFWGKRR